MNKKRNFDGVGAQESQGGTWDRGDYRNLETQNGTRLGGGRGGRGDGRDGKNGGCGGGRGGNGSITNPPTKRDRKIGAEVRTDGKEVGARYR